MRPFLKSVRLEKVLESTSIVSLTYASEYKLEGIELMGVDAGLDWIPGDSKLMEYLEELDDLHLYQVNLEIKTSCEFRARGFDDENDYWEEGANHEIERLETGKIRFISTDEVIDLIELITRIPTNYEISLEEATRHVENVLEEQPELFQLMVDLSLWIKDILLFPKESDKYIHLSNIVRYIKTELRSYYSKKIDDVIQPVHIALTKIYIMISSFAEEDIRILTGSIEKSGFPELFESLPDKIRELEDAELETAEDRFEKLRDSLHFV
ncbi:MAG: hypothetical protein INQ03_13175 [Candidatus Heimdallarchaeota archaeon]|nr:hypothetical protein [Candidatus Heimdallarchaeota archaeon]